MFVVIARPPKPLHDVWYGRRVLGAIDAAGWPLCWILAVRDLVAESGIVGVWVQAVLLMIALRRVYVAVWVNERYHFSTWRWGKLLGWLLLFGGAMKLALLTR